MIKRVTLLPRAQEALDACSDGERARFWKIVSVIKNAPEDGAFVEALTPNQVIRQMTGANMHVQYYVETWAIGQALLVVRIFILDWEPLYLA
jgi:hypothetical protein